MQIVPAAPHRAACIDVSRAATVFPDEAHLQKAYPCIFDKYRSSMVSRRNALQAFASVLLGSVAGCTGDPPATDGTPTASPTPTRTPTTTTEATTEEPSDWTPTWEQSIAEEHALALASFDGRLYAALSNERGPSAVAEVSPADGTLAWRTEFEGETEPHSYADYRPMARDQWGVTLTDASVYSVNGAGDAYDWTAVHALDRANGERRWSLRRDRRLGVHGVADDTVFATGREFYEPAHSHDTPDEPLASVLYAVDAATGEVRWTDEFTGVADVAVGTDAVYVAARDRLVALDFDGTRRWRFDTEQPARSVRAADGRVYYLTEVAGDRSTVHGLDPTGERAWERTLGVHEALLDGDRLYAGGDAVLVLDPDGSVVWQASDHGKWLLLGPRRETLYTRSGGQAVDAYALSSGEALWSFDPPERYAWPEAATGDVAVAEGYAEGRTLYAVGRESGESRKRYSVGRRASVFTVETLDGRVFVGDNGSRITALDP